MKKPCMAVLLAGLCAGPALAAGFTGNTDPSVFAVSNIGTLTGASPTLGSALFSATQLTLAGSNSISPAPASQTPGCSGGVYSTLSSPCQLQVTLARPGVYSFNWVYTSADADGPAGDIFGVIVNGTRIALSDLGGAVAQTGSASFLATASFGWFINCTDCIGGSAQATVSNFVLSAVPEPQSSVLMLLGAVGLGALQRRLRRGAGGAGGTGGNLPTL